MQIDLESVGKRFDRVVALADIDLSLPSGRRVALVGPNGSGKTTLIRIIMGMLAHEGSVLLDRRPAYAERAILARRLAYAPQVAPQMSVPVGEMLQAAASLRDIDSLRIHKIAARLDLDVDAILRRPFRALSGGMKQKLLLAMALAARASLLVLDEPTASLDARARAQFFELYSEISERATLILCSHRLEEIRQMVDHVVVLREGRLIHEGPVDEFIAGRGSSLVEILVAGEPHEERWLSAHGFDRGYGGWWTRSLRPQDKQRILSDALSNLGDGLRDVCVRDLESVEVPGSPDA